jgi:hypothetical protein
MGFFVVVLFGSLGFQYWKYDQLRPGLPPGIIAPTSWTVFSIFILLGLSTLAVLKGLRIKSWFLPALTSIPNFASTIEYLAAHWSALPVPIQVVYHGVFVAIVTVTISLLSKWLPIPSVRHSSEMHVLLFILGIVPVTAIAIHEIGRI